MLRPNKARQGAHEQSSLDPVAKIGSVWTRAPEKRTEKEASPADPVKERLGDESFPRLHLPREG
ncbi:hypothetical protein BCV70DRAFT_1586 [Testicularia cyperi]|uniref:Uncharacterized protein n=1 Tax=Testicularia cyperi TaxID=1882483 RepID=A0A317XXA5_9BASI|nr:hypothetical protein BCV70DRAFT_1586 [Testicularia cyperi]